MNVSLRPDGRWQGRLTSKPLPASDASIEALSPTSREEVARHWLARSASERRVGEAFAVVRDALIAAGADDELVALAERAIDDEHRHTELARLVASRFAGRELPEPEPLALVVPAHPSAGEALRHVLHVVGQCALNETFATAVLEAALRETTGPVAHAALRELLSDEVDHARLGWGYLASVHPDVRAAVVPHLVEMVRANLHAWRTTDRELPSDPALVAQGALSAELIEGALQTALRTLVLPGFAHLGMTSEALEAYVARGAEAPTA